MDIFVITPGGVEIGYENGIDEASGGRLDFDSYGQSTGRWVENIYFPTVGFAPVGNYTFFAETGGNTNGEMIDDIWTLAVYEGDVLVDSHTGLFTGESTRTPFFTYERSVSCAFECCTDADCGDTSAYTCTGNNQCQLIGCSLAEYECCEDSHCSTDQVCDESVCTIKGSPRFTLTWYGDGQ